MMDTPSIAVIAMAMATGGFSVGVWFGLLLHRSATQPPLPHWTIVERDLDRIRMIDELREREGWSLTLVCDNPDFDGGPNCVIEVEGDWVLPFERMGRGLEGVIPIDAAWVSRSFTGDNLWHCLKLALKARKADDDYRGV